jgi:hypothetical protein
MTLFSGVLVTPGVGGQTFPIPNPILLQLAPRVNDQLCTLSEAQDFAHALLAQGDIVPKDQPVYLRQLGANELNVDPAFLVAGYLPMVLEFAGPKPSKEAVDQPYPTSSVKLAPANPFYYSVNIGTVLASAPAVVPGGPFGYQRYFKLQVGPSGTLTWVGLDQPTWPENELTSAGSNPDAGPKPA